MYTEELYHYGVKGMKWHKHVKRGDIRDKEGQHRKREDSGKSAYAKRDDEGFGRDEPVGYGNGHPTLPNHKDIRQKKGRKRTKIGGEAEAKKGERLNSSKGPVSGRAKFAYGTESKHMENVRWGNGTSRRKKQEEEARRKQEEEQKRLYEIKRRKPGRKKPSNAMYQSAMYTERYYNDELYHYGVAGMKWGVRRYQNEDGSLTEAGRARQAKKYAKELNKKDEQSIADKRTIQDAEKAAKRYERAAQFTGKQSYREEAQRRRDSVKENRKNVERNEKEVAKLVEKIKKEGYDVASKEVRRSANTVEDWATSAAITAVAYTVASATAAPYALLFMPGHTVEGTKYKVKSNKG